MAVPVPQALALPGAPSLPAPPPVLCEGETLGDAVVLELALALPGTSVPERRVLGVAVWEGVPV